MDLTHTAVVAERPGRLDEVLVWRHVDLRSPGPGEVRVRMLASTINPSDAVTVSGAYGSRTTFPFVPGFEDVGVVEEVGAGVDAALLGQRVLPIGSAGCWARSKVLDARWCLPVPDGLDDEVACFAHVNPLAARQPDCTITLAPPTAALRALDPSGRS